MKYKFISTPLKRVIDPDEFGALSELIEGTEIFAERNPVENIYMMLL